MKPSRLIVPILFFAGLVFAQEATDTKPKLGEAMTAAQKAYDAGHLDQAEELLNGVRSLVHDDLAAVMLRAKVNFDLGEFGKAETFARRATEIDPNDFDARFLAGKALFQKAET